MTNLLGVNRALIPSYMLLACNLILSPLSPKEVFLLSHPCGLPGARTVSFFYICMYYAGTYAYQTAYIEREIDIPIIYELV